MYAERIYEFYKSVGYDLSRLKLIVSLREPISRELSIYNHKRARWIETKAQWARDVAFADGTVMSYEEYMQYVARPELENPETKGMSASSLYVDHLREWSTYFDRSQILVLSYDEVQKDPEKAEWRVRQFLESDLPGNLPHSNVHEHYTTSVPPNAKEYLNELFEVKNQELYQFLDKNHGPEMEERPFPRFTHS